MLDQSITGSRESQKTFLDLERAALNMHSELPE
jgi:hypothetical protein